MISQGDKVKHYEILEPLGKGGMGEVFLAQDTVLDRKVAIKFLPEEMQKDDKARVRLLREAKAAASLDHPFICKIFEAGEFDGKVFIVMEFVEGKDLRGNLDEGALPLRDSLQIALEIAEALENAHEKGIVHRDLKPSNIMLTPQGHVKVMDFGLAKYFLTEGEGDVTKTLTQNSITEQGAIVGTLAYMSPEQARGETVDARSDVFSLGIIVYEMTTGRHPFSKSSPLETLTSILRDATPPVNIKPKMINPVLSPILRKALAKEPENRYQKIKDLVEEIRKLSREISGGARFLFRGWQMAVGAVLVMAMLLVGFWFITGRSSVGPQEGGPPPISVLIADFQNQTGDSVFDGALEQLLGLSLEGASFISVYDRPQARNLVNELDPGADGQLDAERAQLLSSREGINIVIEASIEPSGDGYSIKVWAMDAAKSEKVAEVTRKIKTKAEVAKAVDYISTKLRSELGGIPSDTTEAFSGETFTASSLIAMNAYAKAQELKNQGKRQEAIKWYLRAIDSDPNLGRAYAGLASVYHNLQQHDEVEKYYQLAMEHIDRMTDREKYRTRGGYYLMKKNYQKAIEEYSALIEQFPADSVAHTNLGFAYFVSRDMKKAAEVGHQAVELNPKKVTPHYNLVWYAMGSCDFETAEHEVNEVINLNPNYYDVYTCKALLEIIQGRTDQAVETYRHLETINPTGASLAATGLADLAVYEGRLNDAIAILEKGVKFDLEIGKNFLAADKYGMLAHAYLAQGKKELALDAANRALNLNQREEVLFTVAQVYIYTGQIDRARNLAGELSKKREPGYRAYAKLIGGELSMARGDVSGAVVLFQEAQSLVDSWLGRFFLGRAFLEDKGYTEAYTEFDACLKRRGEATAIFLNDLPTYRFLPPIFYYLGRAQEGLNSDAASDSYEAFLLIKEKSDEGNPMVEDARHRIRVL